MLKKKIKRKKKEKAKQYFVTNENGNTIYKNQWDEAKAVQRVRFMVMNAYIKKKERS